MATENSTAEEMLIEAINQRDATRLALIAIVKAADPFLRVSRSMAPLALLDDRPLREILPGAWPNWGDFKRLITAIEASTT